MTLNSKLKDYFKEIGLSEDEGFAFCILFHYRLSDYLINTGLADAEKCMLLLNVTENGYELKHALFEKKEYKNFTKFIGLLSANAQIDSMGHVNNPQEYSVINSGEETALEFEKASELIPDFDIEKAVNVVINYYKGVKKGFKLSNYLKNNFVLDYAKFDN
jgi:hypothetical protein